MEHNDLELYCKMLTDKFVALQRELKEEKNKCETLKKQNKKLKQDNESLRREVNLQLREFKQSDSYKQLLEQINQLKKQVKSLRETRDTLISQLNSTTNQKDTL